MQPLLQSHLSSQGASLGILTYVLKTMYLSLQMRELRLREAFSSLSGRGKQLLFCVLDAALKNVHTNKVPHKAIMFCHVSAVMFWEGGPPHLPPSHWVGLSKLSP